MKKSRQYSGTDMDNLLQHLDEQQDVETVELVVYLSGKMLNHDEP
jgi:esterase/lipase superfamily enzyme